MEAKFYAAQCMYITTIVSNKVNVRQYTKYFHFTEFYLNVGKSLDFCFSCIESSGPILRGKINMHHQTYVTVVNGSVPSCMDLSLNDLHNEV